MAGMGEFQMMVIWSLNRKCWGQETEEVLREKQRAGWGDFESKNRKEYPAEE